MDTVARVAGTVARLDKRSYTDWSPESIESFRRDQIQQKFQQLGFTVAETKAFTAHQPAVYERVLTIMEQEEIDPKQIETARNLYKLTGYRRERALAYLDDLGKVVVDFLIANLKGIRHFN